MISKEFTINLTESELNTLIRISKQKLIEVSNEVMKDLEPIEKTSVFVLDETKIEILQDSLNDMTYYLNLYSKLVNTKNKYNLEASI